MCRVTVNENGKIFTFECKKGTTLSALLMKKGIQAEHPCGGQGKCGKCRVTVDGESRLSCKYIIEKNITVVIDSRENVSFPAGYLTECDFSQVCLALDIGTTTLELALVSENEKYIIDSITALNPQKIFGADVMSRIDYCRKHGVKELHDAVVSCINTMTARLLDMYGIESVGRIYVAANTAMLHMFFGVDCSAMGISPYTPQFLEGKNVSAGDIGLIRVKTVVSLPCISAFVGADIVAGLNIAGMPEKGKYNFLVDLGTNAEIVLYSSDRVICTSAAAGPCFEGANISCGMGAVEGAVCAYNYGEKPITIGNSEPVGICATGLISVIAELLKNGIIDETGFMAEERFVLADGVYLTREDIRNYQLAKSAVYSAVITLMRKTGITFRDIDKFFVSGGISSALNIEAAVSTGLLPAEAFYKYHVVDNTSLAGTVKYIFENNDLSVFTENACYEDLASEPVFSELFIENMMFTFYE